MGLSVSENWLLIVRRYRDRAVRWRTESKGESSFFCFWLPLKTRLTDAAAIITTVFLRVRALGWIILPLVILHACRTQCSCRDTPRIERRPPTNCRDCLVNRSPLPLTYPHLTKVAEQRYSRCSLWSCSRHTLCSSARIRRHLSACMRATRRMTRKRCWMRCTPPVTLGASPI